MCFSKSNLNNTKTLHIFNKKTGKKGICKCTMIYKTSLKISNHHKGISNIIHYILDNMFQTIPITKTNLSITEALETMKNTTIVVK